VSFSKSISYPFLRSRYGVAQRQHKPLCQCGCEGGCAAGGMTAEDGGGAAESGVLDAAVTGADTVPGGTVALPGAATTIGCPTLPASSGCMIGGHSAATAGSMFQRRNLVLSMWKRR